MLNNDAHKNTPSDKEDLIKSILSERPDYSRDKINQAIERCAQIIPPPRHRSAFLQTIHWYLKLM